MDIKNIAVSRVPVKQFRVRTTARAWERLGSGKGLEARARARSG